MGVREHTVRLEAQEMIDTKTCIRCGKIKPLIDFGFNVRGYKKRQSCCKKCKKKSDARYST